MDMWKWRAPAGNSRELYYYDTTKEFEAAQLAARLYMMIQEEMKGLLLINRRNIRQVKSLNELGKI